MNFLLTGVRGSFPAITASMFSMHSRSNPSKVSIATPPMWGKSVTFSISINSLRTYANQRRLPGTEYIRFIVMHIKSSAENFATFQGVNKGILVNDLSSRRIDESHPILHLGNRIFIYQ